MNVTRKQYEEQANAIANLADAIATNTHSGGRRWMPMAFVLAAGSLLRCKR